MAVFWISFRIANKTVDRQTYDERYGAFEKAVKALSTTYWKETTSFIVFQTESGLIQVAQKLKAAIAPSEDVFLIRAMDSKNAMVCGNNTDRKIFDLMISEGKTYLTIV